MLTIICWQKSYFYYAQSKFIGIKILFFSTVLIYSCATSINWQVPLPETWRENYIRFTLSVSIGSRDEKVSYFLKRDKDHHPWLKFPWLPCLHSLSFFSWTIFVASFTTSHFIHIISFYFFHDLVISRPTSFTVFSEDSSAFAASSAVRCFT